MIFENYISGNKEAFLEKVNKIAGKLRTEPEFLMAVMYKESRINPQAQNPNGSATGLIQFMPKTAAGLGTTVHQLKQMNSLQQLDYVYKYYKPYTGKLNTYPDLYLATFFPAALGKPGDWIMQSETLSPVTIAVSNPAIDINNNGEITVDEFREYCYNGLPDEAKKTLKIKSNYFMRNLELIVLALTLISVSLSLYLKLK